MTDRKLRTKVILVTAFLAAAIRVALLLVYEPVAYSDTPSYRRLAEAVLNGFQRYDGTRTPGYPIFLALVGGDRQVYIAQLLLGFFTTLLLVWIGWQLTRNIWLASGIGMAHTLNLGQLFFEANLLTETLSTFLLTLSLAAMMYWLTGPKRSNWVLVATGVLSGLAAITRPLFIYLPFWLSIITVCYSAEKKVKSGLENIPLHKQFAAWLIPIIKWQVLLKVMALLVPAMLILGGWISFIHDRYHMWSLSTMTGYHMIQHTGNFFEYLPDDYADLRDTYLKYRQAHIETYGTQTNTIWEAIPELQKVSGLTFYDLSRKLSQLSSWLIVRHPGFYLRNVLKGWWLFWRAPVYWQADAFHWPFLAEITPALVIVQRGLLVAANMLFVIASLPALFVRRLMPGENGHWAFLWCLVGTIWAASIVQTLVDHGDNPRFLVPMQSFVILWVVWLAYQLWKQFRKKHETT